MIEDFGKIEVGQWVWTEGERWSPNSNRRIREVTRLTRTLIICDDGDAFERFSRENGFNKHPYSKYNSIVSVATPEEVATVGIPLKESREKEKIRIAKCDEIKAILPPNMTAWLNYEGMWEAKIEVKGIGEDRMRKLATHVAEALSD